MAKPGAHRKFYDFSSSDVHHESFFSAKDKSDEFIHYVSQNIIGSDTVFSSPFGPRRGLHLAKFLFINFCSQGIFQPFSLICVDNV